MNYEIDVIQSQVEVNLKRDGVCYAREALLPLHGKADFILYLREGSYVLECKRDCAEIRKAIAQVLFYAVQLGPQYGAVIAVPDGMKTIEAERLCTRWNVKLRTVQVQSISDYELDLLFTANSNGRH